LNCTPARSAIACPPLLNANSSYIVASNSWDAGTVSGNYEAI